MLNYLLLEKPSIISETLADPGAFDSTEINEIAHLTELEDYLELLYEGISEKLRASALILQLARNSDNLEELFQNGQLKPHLHNLCFVFIVLQILSSLQRIKNRYLSQRL